MNVFMFSDNVTLEDEVKLKQKAHEKGLAVIGTGLWYGDHFRVFRLHLQIM